MTFDFLKLNIRLCKVDDSRNKTVVICRSEAGEFWKKNDLPTISKLLGNYCIE